MSSVLWVLEELISHSVLLKFLLALSLTIIWWGLRLKGWVNVTITYFDISIMMITVVNIF